MTDQSDPNTEPTDQSSPTQTAITSSYKRLRMPVDFTAHRPVDLPGEDTNGRRIIEFLAENPDTGFRPMELAERLDIPRGSVGTTLARLHDRGLVRHKGVYWAIDPEAFDAHTASVIGLRTVAVDFAGDEYDTDPEWDADLPGIDSDSVDDEPTGT